MAGAVLHKKRRLLYMSNQSDLFGVAEPNKWRDEWRGMPEYDNEDITEPAITVTVRFRTEEDFFVFQEHLRTHLWKGEKPFDGRQTKTEKTTWFPPREKSSSFVYVDSEGATR